MKRGALFWLAACLCGCGDDTAALNPDAAADAPPSIDAPSPDAAACSSSRDAGAGAYRIFLVFEGVALTHGTRDDAPTNTTMIGTIDPTVPPFLAGMAGRQAIIDQIVADLQQALAPFDVELTTTRPASGEYEMIAFGGNCMNVLGPGCRPSAPRAFSTDCGDLNHNNVIFVFDIDNTAFLAANDALTGLVVSVGLSPTTAPGDCACLSCVTPPDRLCTLGQMTPVDTMTFGCPAAGPTQDEQAYLRNIFGCR